MRHKKVNTSSTQQVKNVRKRLGEGPLADPTHIEAKTMWACDGGLVLIPIGQAVHTKMSICHFSGLL